MIALTAKTATASCQFHKKIARTFWKRPALRKSTNKKQLSVCKLDTRGKFADVLARSSASRNHVAVNWMELTVKSIETVFPVAVLVKDVKIQTGATNMTRLPFAAISLKLCWNYEERNIYGTGIQSIKNIHPICKILTKLLALLQFHSARSISEVYGSLAIYKRMPESIVSAAAVLTIIYCGIQWEQK